MKCHNILSQNSAKASRQGQHLRFGGAARKFAAYYIKCLFGRTNIKHMCLYHIDGTDRAASCAHTAAHAFFRFREKGEGVKIAGCAGL